MSSASGLLGYRVIILDIRLFNGLHEVNIVDLYDFVFHHF